MSDGMTTMHFRRRSKVNQPIEPQLEPDDQWVVAKLIEVGIEVSLLFIAVAIVFAVAEAFL